MKYTRFPGSFHYNIFEEIISNRWHYDNENFLRNLTQLTRYLIYLTFTAAEKKFLVLLMQRSVMGEP